MAIKFWKYTLDENDCMVDYELDESEFISLIHDHWFEIIYANKIYVEYDPFYHLNAYVSVMIKYQNTIISCEFASLYSSDIYFKIHFPLYDIRFTTLK